MFFNTSPPRVWGQKETSRQSSLLFYIAYTAGLPWTKPLNQAEKSVRLSPSLMNDTAGEKQDNAVLNYLFFCKWHQLWLPPRRVCSVFLTDSTRLERVCCRRVCMERGRSLDLNLGMNYPVFFFSSLPLVPVTSFVLALLMWPWGEPIQRPGADENLTQIETGRLAVNQSSSLNWPTA